MKITENNLHTSESQHPVPPVETGDENQLSGFFNDPDLDLIPKIADVEAPVTEWIVPDVIAQGEYHLITGAPASMKSMLALSMGYAISTGSEVFGRPTVQKPVLYIDKENPVGLIKERQDLLHLTDESNLYYWGSWFNEIPTCCDPVYLRLVERYKPVIIFDSLIRFHTMDENEATAMRSVSQSFRKLCYLGATVIALHHQGKPSLGYRSPFRGSSEIEAGCDIGYCLTKTKTTDGLVLKVGCFKTRHGLESEFRLKFDRGLFLPQATNEEIEQEHMQAIAQCIAENPKASVAKIQQHTQIAERKLRGLLKEGKDEFWTVESGPHNRQRYLSLNQEG